MTTHHPAAWRRLRHSPPHVWPVRRHRHRAGVDL